ncbi:hypothetical protein IS481_12030 [Caldimonas thermodepolymerans]|uniref:Uncharacterized protein n=1 Tax=Caldimonas thermodepolymerans TaxID=215580 RepID=A0A2S5T8Y5_9BURK|nr:hypothetical protein [Caldimonas thermodepolymerans]PPE71470.1 hypothetical protein C1702_00250 [Caldimonas thermodepolymerans]QPC30498.1 hypothetical protein IS481_12030 [Caldimonas thermodepolymerans]
MDYPDDSGLPSGLPAPSALRILAAHLAAQLPTEEALSLVKRKEYPLIHELAGYHEAVDAINAIAEQLEEAAREAQKAQGLSL